MPQRLSARQRLLNSAAELFYSDGVGATGIDAITAHAGVARMSLYNNFASKAELVDAYLRRRIDEWQAFYQRRIEAAATAGDRVLAVFDSYVDHAGLAYEWGFRGCGLLNAAAELPAGHPGRALVAWQKAEAERLFRLHLAELYPANPARVDETAEHLSLLLEGAMARAGLDGKDGRLKAARRIAASMLERR